MVLKSQNESLSLTRHYQVHISGFKYKQSQRVSPIKNSSSEWNKELKKPETFKPPVPASIYEMITDWTLLSVKAEKSAHRISCEHVTVKCPELNSSITIILWESKCALKSIVMEEITDSTSQKEVKASIKVLDFKCGKLNVFLRQNKKPLLSLLCP